MAVCLHSSFTVVFVELKQVCFSEFYLGLDIWSLSIIYIFKTDTLITIINQLPLLYLKLSMLNQLFVNMSVVMNTPKADSRGVHLALCQKL